MGAAGNTCRQFHHFLNFLTVLDAGAEIMDQSGSQILREEMSSSCLSDVLTTNPPRAGG